MTLTSKSSSLRRRADVCGNCGSFYFQSVYYNVSAFFHVFAW